MAKTLNNTNTRLTVIGEADRSAAGRRRVLCRCICGRETIVHLYNFRSGMTRSCGCLRDELIRQVNFSHGAAKSRIFHIWVRMRQRCLNPSNPRYGDYGGRGITVCERWLHSFDNFLSDMGDRPGPQYSVERKDNNLGYSPDNCVWATAAEQGQNSRHNRNITYQGQTLCVNEWARRLGLNRRTISARLKAGWSVEAALSTPLRK